MPGRHHENVAVSIHHTSQARVCANKSPLPSRSMCVVCHNRQTNVAHSMWRIAHAGEWEYFAAGSQHPFPYALAELIDNSLRATRGNTRARNIVVSLVAAHAGQPGLVSVWDNGCGMTMRQLGEWAVMNLTMEDRGAQPQEAERPRTTQSAACAKQLCSDLSYFGVGSKNAGFFMGRCIKLVSRGQGNMLVHELAIDADTLEQCYREAPDQARHGVCRLACVDCLAFWCLAHPYAAMLAHMLCTTFCSGDHKRQRLPALRCLLAKLVHSWHVHTALRRHSCVPLLTQAGVQGEHHQALAWPFGRGQPGSTARRNSVSMADRGAGSR